MNGWVGEWIEWMNGWMDGWGRVNGCVGEYTDGGLGGWMID